MDILKFQDTACRHSMWIPQYSMIKQQRLPHYFSTHASELLANRLALTIVKEHMVNMVIFSINAVSVLPTVRQTRESAYHN
jgi:hypothetical protein